MKKKELKERIKELEEELERSYTRANHLLPLLAAIPACPNHGADCTRYALKWINSCKMMLLQIAEGQWVWAEKKGGGRKIAPGLILDMSKFSLGDIRNFKEKLEE